MSLVADPIATRKIQAVLDDQVDYKGTVKRVHITFLPPGLELENFKLIEKPDGRWNEPLFYAKHTVATLVWRKLLSFQVVARAVVIDPKIIVARQHEKKLKKSKDIGAEAQEQFPLKLDQVEVQNGDVLFSEGMGKNVPKIWIHDINVLAKNFATVKTLMEDKPATVHADAIVQRSGRAKVSVAADPFAKKPTFEGKASLKDLAIKDLYSFMVPKTGMYATQGTIDVFTDFNVNNGVMKGGVKRLLKNVEIKSADNGLFDRLKAWMVDEAIDLVEDDVPGRKAVATIVPLRGRIDNPDVQLVPAVLGILRNAFVTALRSGFAGVPPPEADKKEGVIPQTLHALSKNAGPPKAQPTGADQKTQRK